MAPRNYGPKFSSGARLEAAEQLFSRHLDGILIAFDAAYLVGGHICMRSLVAQLPVPNEHGATHHSMPRLATNAGHKAYIRARTEAWHASRTPNPSRRLSLRMLHPG